MNKLIYLLLLYSLGSSIGCARIYSKDIVNYEIDNNYIGNLHSLNINNLRQIYIPKTEFLIIGAGPAGLATMGLLLEIGVEPSDIIILDPEYNVGRIGKYYQEVPGNTKNKLFVDFVKSCKSFRECSSLAIDNLLLCDQDKEYKLKYIVNALKAITQHLCSKVRSIKGELKSLYFKDNMWHVGTNYITIKSQRVVLATGSHPRELNYNKEKEISLDEALDQNKLKKIINKDDTVLVVGGAHSAILLLKFLHEMGVKQIINLYKKPLKYAQDMGDWILYNSDGLKGITARWAKNILEGDPPKNILRLYNNQENLNKALNSATKIIYACGYERNELPCIKENPKLTYDSTTGIIAPGLFGIGIAFPEKYTDPMGNTEYRVGLSSFIEYAQKVVPYWAKGNKNNLNSINKFEKLFDITLL